MISRINSSRTNGFLTPGSPKIYKLKSKRLGSVRRDKVNPTNCMAFPTFVFEEFVVSTVGIIYDRYELRRYDIQR